MPAGQVMPRRACAVFGKHNYDGLVTMRRLSSSLLSLFSSDLAIDLGTANSLVFCKGQGIVVREPSIIAVNQKTGKVEAVGGPAKAMLGRTPGNIILIRPMQDGRPSFVFEKWRALRDFRGQNGIW